MLIDRSEAVRIMEIKEKRYNGGIMRNKCKYSAEVHQNDTIIVSYYSDDLPSVRNMLQNLVEQDIQSLTARVIDNDMNSVVFKINNAHDYAA